MDFLDMRHTGTKSCWSKLYRRIFISLMEDLAISFCLTFSCGTMGINACRPNAGDVGLTTSSGHTIVI